MAAQDPFFNVGNDELLRRVKSRPLGSLEVDPERKELVSRGFSPKDFASASGSPTAYRSLAPEIGLATTHDERFPMAGFAAVLGILLVAIGLYLLVVVPSVEAGIVNLQRLTIGETLTISGAIFIAAGMLMHAPSPRTH